MKQIIVACTMLLPFASVVAQESVAEGRKETTVQTSGDSIIIHKGDGNVKIKIYEEYTDNSKSKQEEKLYEGVYLTRVNEDRRSIIDALPFAPKKRGKRHFRPHSSAFYIGFANLSDHFLRFGSSHNTSLELAKSWEIGFNLLDNSINLGHTNHWGLAYSIGWGYRSFQLDSNQAFVKENGMTQVVNGTEEIVYSESRLRYFYFRIPLAIEWQTRVSGKDLLFCSIGPEFEIRHGIRSMAKINGSKETLGKELYINPVGINLLVQAGYDDFGFYLRYSTYGLFQKGKGPKVDPLSFGLAWYW